MGGNKMVFVVIGAFVAVWTASIVYTYFYYGNTMPFVFNIKGDGKLAMTTAPTLTPEPAYPIPTPNLQSQPTRADKGIIEYLLGCEIHCP